MPSNAAPSNRATASFGVPAPPLPARLLTSDLVIGAVGLVAVATGVWVVHGGLSALLEGWNGAWTSIAELSGIACSVAGMLGLTLASRASVIERRVGLDRMLIWHRYLGETMALALGLHVVAGLVEYAPISGGYLAALKDLTGREPYMAGATIGALVVGLVTVSSLRSVRQRLAYETWYFVHLLAYGGLALAFGHQIFLGSDFANDRIARWFWVGASVAVVVGLVASRWGGLARAWVRPWTVVSVDRQLGDAVSISVSGPALAGARVDAGQFFLLRARSADLWWQAHPFSLSAAPSSRGLRFTVKRRGDATAALARLRPGTKVVLEGPYGVCTPETLAGRKVVFVAGGVGIGPVRALLERLDPSAAPVVLYRAHKNSDLIHLDELEQLAAARNGLVRVLVGPTAALAKRDPFAPGSLRAVVPDVAERVAVLCGPESLLWAARSGLRAAGVPASEIHFERPWW